MRPGVWRALRAPPKSCSTNGQTRDSLRYGWTLNLKKTVIVIFGTAAQRAQFAGATLFWGSEEMRMVDSTKYLGVHFSADASWDTHVKAAVAKGQAAFHAWAPVLASPRIHVHTKKRVIATYIRPVMEYASEIWSTPLGTHHTVNMSGMDAVLRAACALACGVRASRSERSWMRNACVNTEVMGLDMDVLPAADVARIARLRYAERAASADARAQSLPAHDASAAEYVGALPANTSPDYMNAAVRAALPAGDRWLEDVASTRRLVRAYVGADRDGKPIRNADIVAAVTADARSRALAAHSAVPRAPHVSMRGRVLRPVRQTPLVLHPATTVLAAGALRPSYLRVPDAATYSVLCLRSGHLPIDATERARRRYALDSCPDCQAQLVCVAEELSAEERRWRHVQHALVDCAVCGGGNGPAGLRPVWPTVRVLLADLRQAVGGAGAPRVAVDAAFAGLRAIVGVGQQAWSPAQVRTLCIPFLLDPGMPSCTCSVLQSNCVRIVAAYTELVSALRVRGCTPDVSRLRAIGLPASSLLREFCPAAWGVQALLTADADSDDEVVLCPAACVGSVRCSSVSPPLSSTPVLSRSAPRGAEADGLLA